MRQNLFLSFAIGALSLVSTPALATCIYAGEEYSTGATRDGQRCTQDGTWDDIPEVGGRGVAIHARNLDPALLTLEVKKPEARMCKSTLKVEDKFVYCHTSGYSGAPPLGTPCSCRVGFGSNERRVSGTVVDINNDDDYE